METNYPSKNFPNNQKVRGRVILSVKKGDKSFLQSLNFLSLSFSDGQPVMATGSTIGHVTFWDLEKKRLITVLRHAHANSVSGMKFLQRQPTMITSSPDNSLKVKYKIDFIRHKYWIET